MPLHPQAQALLEQMKQMGFVYSPELTVDRAREMQQMMIEVRGTPEPVAAVADRLIPGPAGDIPIRISPPQGSGPFPVLVFFHTGGWQVGNLLQALKAYRFEEMSEFYTALIGIHPNAEAGTFGW